MKSFKVPTIQELVNSSLNDISENEERIRLLKQSNPNSYEINSLQREVDKWKGIVEKYKSETRDFKLGQLGLN